MHTITPFSQASLLAAVQIALIRLPGPSALCAEAGSIDPVITTGLELLTVR